MLAETELGARAAREELSGSMDRIARPGRQMTSIATVQNSQIDGFSRQLVELASNERRFDALAAHRRAANCRSCSRTQCLEARADPRDGGRKLHARSSIAPVGIVQAGLRAPRAGAQGLGRDATLAAGVGDLKRVLTNVKTRGTWGEGATRRRWLEQMMTVRAVQKKLATRPARTSRGIRAASARPRGRGAGIAAIDAKFSARGFPALHEAQTRPTLRRWKQPRRRSRCASGSSEGESARSTSSRRRRPTSRCSTCRSKACNAERCAARGCSTCCSAISRHARRPAT